MSKMSIWDWQSVAQHHEEGALVVAESLQRVLVKADRTRWKGEKGKWAKNQRLPVYSPLFYSLAPRSTDVFKTPNGRDLCAPWQFKKNKVTLDAPFPPDTAQEPAGEGDQEDFPACCMGRAAALGWMVVALVPLELVGSSQLRKVPPGLALPRCLAEYMLLRTFA